MKSEYISMRKVNLDMNLRKNAEQEYEKRIQSPSAIVFDLQICGRPLFVMLTPPLLASIVAIHKQSAVLSELQFSLPGIAISWYVKKLLVDEIGLTNEMENVHSTRKEVKEAVESVQSLKTPVRNVRFWGMADKYNSLLSGKTAELKTCRDIRKLYDAFVQQEVIAEDEKDRPDGEIFRKGTVMVQDSHGNKIHEGVYPESDIIDTMEHALALLNDASIDRIIRIAMFHYLFGYIHPFYNGNGRLSRYISSMLLSAELGTLAGLRLSYVIKNHKKQYDHLFRDANDPHSMGDITDFVLTFCTYIKEALTDMAETLQAGEETIKGIGRVIGNRPEFKGYERIIDILALNGVFAEDALSMDELRTHADCGRKLVQDALDVAKKLGILSQSRQGHKYLYTIRPEAWPYLIKKDNGA